MRKSHDLVFLEIAIALAQRATCVNRSVGCVMVDSRKRIIASGYNGTAPGALHCVDTPCPGAHYTREEDKVKCQAIHAEQNALVQCKIPDEIHTVYCTHSPCIQCIKMLSSTGAKRIVFFTSSPDKASMEYWLNHGGEWNNVDREFTKPPMGELKPSTPYPIQISPTPQNPKTYDVLADLIPIMHTKTLRGCLVSLLTKAAIKLGELNDKNSNDPS